VAGSNQPRSRRQRTIALTTIVTLLSGWFLIARPALATHVECDGNDVNHVPYLGSDSDDHLTGNDNNNTMHGQGGKDTLEGYGGEDRLCGGGDRDVLFGDGQMDRLFGGDACDRIMGGPGSDRIEGKAGHDSQFASIAGCDNAGFFSDWGGGLIGNEDNDDLYGGTERDYATGGEGTNDYADLGPGADWCDMSSTETLVDCENPI
jgi:Ca2+-binding RTX toxin-like protein